MFIASVIYIQRTTGCMNWIQTLIAALYSLNCLRDSDLETCWLHGSDFQLVGFHSILDAHCVCNSNYSVNLLGDSELLAPRQVFQGSLALFFRFEASSGVRSRVVEWSGINRIFMLWSLCCFHLGAANIPHARAVKADREEEKGDQIRGETREEEVCEERVKGKMREDR